MPKLFSTVSEVTRGVVERVDPDSVASADELRFRGMSRAASTASSARLDMGSVFQGAVSKANKGTDPLDRTATTLATLMMQNVAVVNDVLKQTQRRSSIDLAKRAVTNAATRLLKESKEEREERQRSERESKAAAKLRAETSKALGIDSPENAFVQELINDFLVSTLFLANNDIFKDTQQAIEGGKTFVSGQLRVNPELPRQIFAALVQLAKDPEGYKKNLDRVAGVDAQITDFSQKLQVALGKTIGIGDPSSRDADLFFEFKMPFFKSGSDKASMAQEEALFNEYKDALKFLMQSMVLSKRIVPSYVGANGSEPGKYVFQVKTSAGQLPITVHEEVGMYLGVPDARIGKDIILMALGIIEDDDLTRKGTIFYVGLPEDPEVLKKLHDFLSKYATPELQRQYEGLKNYLHRVEGKMKELGTEVSDSAAATVGQTDAGAKSAAYASNKVTAPEVPKAATTATTASQTGLPPIAPTTVKTKPPVPPARTTTTAVQPPPPARGAPAQSAPVSGSGPTEEEMKKFAKYLKMLKNGIPIGAVANKLSLDVASDSRLELDDANFARIFGEPRPGIEKARVVAAAPKPVIPSGGPSVASGPSVKPPAAANTSLMEEIRKRDFNLRPSSKETNKTAPPPPTTTTKGLADSMAQSRAFAAAAEKARLDEARKKRRDALRQSDDDDQNQDDDTSWDGDNTSPKSPKGGGKKGG